MKTIRLTMAQALIRFLDNQFIEMDKERYKFVKGIIGIFGHGNVTGLGEALEYTNTDLVYIQGHNEQGMVHTATAFAKQNNRMQIFACTSSIGPGALNMVNGAAVATVNHIPVLLLPGDNFACRQPDPVLQQLEVPSDYTVTNNDCFKPVSRYWDRIERPEQLMTAMFNAFRVLTSPVDTGAVTICLPQDVQAEAYNYPVDFFEPRVHYVDRCQVNDRALKAAVEKIKVAKRPILFAGGGVHYSKAASELTRFAEKFGIPVAETQAGKSAISWKSPMSVGGVGVTGTKAANDLAEKTDLVLAVGTRLGDFTTASKKAFPLSDVQIINLNIAAFDGYKMGGMPLTGDAREGLKSLEKHLDSIAYQTDDSYQSEISELRNWWNNEVNRLYSSSSNVGNNQAAIVGALNNFMDPNDVIVCAAGSLPGDLHRVWRCEKPKSYHMEYGFSCMGYEVAGGLGTKMAEPDREVYVIIGDGSFLMLHSELLTSIQEGYKINIVLLDNHGFQCIKNLQQANGSQGFGNEIRYRESSTGRLTGDVIEIDFCQYAGALGVKTFFAEDLSTFKNALEEAKKETRSTLIEIKVEPGTMTNGYNSWWRVGVAEVSESRAVLDAHREMADNVKKVRNF